MKQRKKVAHVIYDLATAGAQTVVMNYLRSMKKCSDYDMCIVVGNSYTGLQYEKEARDKGFEVVYANYKETNSYGVLRPLVNWIKYQRALYKALKSVSPDIVHTHLTKILPYVFLPLLILGKKNVHTLHSDPYAIPNRFYYFALIVFHLFHIKIIGVTESQAEKAKKRYHLRPVPVVHNGLNLEKYNISESKTDIRKELGIEEEAFVIGTVGRLDKIKNHPFLIKVFKQVIKDMPNAVLLFVGDGVERKHLQSLVEDYNLSENVVFAGLRKDVERMYHAMDVFAMTSFFESSSIVTVEAQASGVRCVIADSIPDNVIVTGMVSSLPLNAPITDWVSAIKGNYPKRKQVSDMKKFSMDRTIYELREVYNNL